MDAETQGEPPVTVAHVVTQVEPPVTVAHVVTQVEPSLVIEETDLNERDGTPVDTRSLKQEILPERDSIDEVASREKSVEETFESFHRPLD